MAITRGGGRDGGGRRGDRGKAPVVEEEPPYAPPVTDSDDEDYGYSCGPDAFDDAGPSDPSGGVQNKSIRYMEATHRSSNFSSSGTVNNNPVRVRQHHLKMNIHDKYLPFFEEAGLLRCMNISPILIDAYLITALAERWREETHSFHMPQGEMTITLQDVSFLLGLPIDGEPLCMKTGPGINWAEKVQTLLGKVDNDTFRPKSKVYIKLSWLRANFHTLPEKHTDLDVVQHARAYLLTYFGNVLFPDLTGDSVSAILLTLLEDMENLGRFSWGSGVLAYLYRQLCKGTNPDRLEIGGCVLLMQLWSWMRFPVGRPTIRVGNTISSLGHNDPNQRPFEWVLFQRSSSFSFFFFFFFFFFSLPSLFLLSSLLTLFSQFL